MKKTLYYVPIITASMIGLSQSSRADRIPVVARYQQISPELGSGYSSKMNKFEDIATCVQPAGGKPKPSGQNSAEIEFGTVIDEKRLATEFGLGIDGSARIGPGQLEAAAEFLKNTKSTEYSISQTYLANYNFHNLSIRSDAELTNFAKGLTDPEVFEQVCGDKFTSQLELGAKLFYTVRIDFNSKEEKSSFETHFKFKSPLYSASADFKTALDQFSKNAKVKVNAFQVGGDISQLSLIFGTTGSIVPCSNGDIQRCMTALSDMHQFAVKTFPNTIDVNAPIGNAKGPAVVAAYVEDYQVAKHVVDMSKPGLQMAMSAKNSISNKFKDHFLQYIEVITLLDNKARSLSPRQENSLKSLKDQLKSNLDLIIAASEKCSKSVKYCSDLLNILENREPNNTQLTPKVVKNLSPVGVVKAIVPVTAQQIMDATNPVDFPEFCMMGLDDQYGTTELGRTASSLKILVELEDPGSINPKDSLSDQCNVIFDHFIGKTQLDLRSRNVTLNEEPVELKFPDMTLISYFNSLQELNLSNNEIREIRKLNSLTNLKKLTLTNNFIRNVTPLSQLQHLEVVDLGGNSGIKTVDPLKNLANITYLRIDKGLTCPFEDPARCIIGTIECRTSMMNCLALPHGFDRCQNIACEALPGGNEAIILNSPGTPPSSKTWHFNGSKITEHGTLKFGRYNPTSVALDDGTFLVVGGWGKSDVLETVSVPGTAEVYNPRTKTSDLFLDLKNNRTGSTATKLQDGRVLITGGFEGNNFNFSTTSSHTAEIYNPKTKAMETRLPNMDTPRAAHQAVHLPRGKGVQKVLILGGYSSIASSRDVEVYDAEANKFETLDPMHIGRDHFTATLLADKRHVLITGGVSQRKPKPAIEGSAELYDIETGRSTLLVSRLSNSRAGHGAVLLENGQVLIAGGTKEYTDKNALDTMEVFDPISQSFTVQPINLCAYREITKLVHLNGRQILCLSANDKGGTEGKKKFEVINENGKAGSVNQAEVIKY